MLGRLPPRFSQSYGDWSKGWGKGWGKDPWGKGKGKGKGKPRGLPLFACSVAINSRIQFYIRDLLDLIVIVVVVALSTRSPRAA